MNVSEELTKIINKLNEIDNYNNHLIDMLSNLDLQQQDLLHYIENNQLKTNECYRMIRELKRIRNERRKVKNDISLLSKYNEHKSKLLSFEYRKFLNQELNKEVKKQNNKRYENKAYTEEKIKNILKGV